MEVATISMICQVEDAFQIKLYKIFSLFSFESKTITKHISCNCKCKFDGKKCILSQKWNKDKCQCECKNPIKKRVLVKTIIFGIVHALVRMVNI